MAQKTRTISDVESNTLSLFPQKILTHTANENHDNQNQRNSSGKTHRECQRQLDK